MVLRYSALTASRRPGFETRLFFNFFFRNLSTKATKWKKTKYVEEYKMDKIENKEDYSTRTKTEVETGDLNSPNMLYSVKIVIEFTELNKLKKHPFGH